MTRKNPFSGKQKKQQLLAKRLAKAKQALEEEGGGGGGGDGKGNFPNSSSSSAATGYDSHLRGGQVLNLEGLSRDGGGHGRNKGSAGGGGKVKGGRGQNKPKGGVRTQILRNARQHNDDLDAAAAAGTGGRRRKGGVRDNAARERERRLASVPITRRVNPGEPLPELPESECGKCPDPRDFVPIPLRPAWKRGMPAAQLEAREVRAMSEWLDEIARREEEEREKRAEAKKKKARNEGESASGTTTTASNNGNSYNSSNGDHGEDPGGAVDGEGFDSDERVINWFEHNIETWRQLWRVCERSDVVVVVVDARFPLLLMSDALWDYVCERLGKPIVLVLNKSDLVPEEVVEAWRVYLEDRYGRVKVVPFRSPHIAFKGKRERSNEELQQVRGLLRVIGEQRIVKEVEGGEAVTVEAEKYFDPDHHLTPGLGKRGKDHHHHGEGGGDDDGNGNGSGGQGTTAEEEHPASGDHKRQDSLMIGFVGHPNVGKSSLINTIFGAKRVSFSRTPGHTKHFQTLFFQRSVQVCDSPGVVFPGFGVPRALQVLSGSYPIAQLRKQMAVLRYLAERCVPSLDVAYKLTLPEGCESGWSPWALSEALAEKKGFHTRGGAPDVARAANYYLRAALNGDPPLVFLPPGTISKSTSSNSNGADKGSSSSSGVCSGKSVPVGLLAPEDCRSDWVRERQAMFTAGLRTGNRTRGGGKGEFADAFVFPGDGNEYSDGSDDDDDGSDGSEGSDDGGDGGSYGSDDDGGSDDGGGSDDDDDDDDDDSASSDAIAAPSNPFALLADD